MDPTIQIAIITLTGTVVAPLLLVFLTASLRRSDRKADWAREDAVAEAVVEVARLAAEADARTTASLREIHILVNSDMTAARQQELVATQALLALLLRIQMPNDDDIKAITVTRARIFELQLILADRFAAQQDVKKQQEVVRIEQERGA